MVPHIPLYRTSTRPEDGELAELAKRTVDNKYVENILSS